MSDPKKSKIDPPKKKPIIVESKKDPRYKAYQDSLDLYNYSNRNKKYIGEYLKSKLDDNPSILLHKLDENTRNSFNDIYYNEQVERNFNKIKPVHRTNVHGSAQGVKNNLLFTIPFWKKPEQQIIVKQPEKPTYYKDTPQVESINMNPVGIQSNFKLEAPIPNVPTQARIPKYFDVTDKVNQNFGGSESSYKYYPGEGDLQELSQEKYEDGTPYNTRKIVPRYSLGGYIQQDKLSPTLNNYLNPTKQYSQGGWLDEFADGGPIDPPKYGSPEYAKAWKNGQIQRKEATGEVGKEFWGGELDEVVLRRTPKNARAEIRQAEPDQSYYDRTKEILINPLTAFGYAARNEDLPQRFSRNTEGRNALDNVIDMVNPVAIGEGIANIPSNIGKGNYMDAAGSILDAMPLGISAASKTRRLLNNKLSHNKLVKSYVPNELVNTEKTPIEFLKDWYSSPVTKERMSEGTKAFGQSQSLPKSIRDLKSEDLIETINSDLNNYKKKTYRDMLSPNMPLSELVDNYKTTHGVSYGTPDAIFSKSKAWDPIDNFRFGTFPNRAGTEVHEISHLTNKNGDALNLNERERLLNPFGLNEKLREGLPKNAKYKDTRYYTNPTEIKARMDQARYLLNKKPGELFTKEEFDLINNDNQWFGMGQYIKDDEEFIDLLNSFYTPAAGAAVGGLGLKYMNSDTNNNQFYKGGYLNQKRSIKSNWLDQL
jgi:hypothetical protein